VWWDIEVSSILLSFNNECVNTVIAAMLGVIGKKASNANRLQLDLNNFCIQESILLIFSTTFLLSACSDFLD
tara:strand:- start:328 stop:543 length:216 start_codon:yes stop_codon:yes gene_type:complete